jgi:hypothetical protein
MSWTGRAGVIWTVVLTLLVTLASSAQAGPLKPGAAGGLDCNGHSPVQTTIAPPIACTDIRGFQNESNANTWDGRFYDNGYYIGHDEPDLTYFSGKNGSGNDVNWNETLPLDPSRLPTVAHPGSDVTHYFELTVAPWFGMALCDGTSYPQLPCTPNSDRNAPAPCTIASSPCARGYDGGGSAFLEMQFYPPGHAPFIDSVSCDNTHWCASLHINELMCTYGFVRCNANCEETTNFAFVQRDGVPTGPPSPQLSDNATSEPNGETLLMNPGDQLKIHIWDAPAPGGGSALEVSIDDLTTGQYGFMQASAANGFAQTSIADCSGTPFNFEPEYQTAERPNIVPWAALQANISTEFEIGHFTPCTSVTGAAGNGPGGTGDPIFSTCVGPYETAPDSGNAEESDVPCYPLGDTHGTLASDPDEVAGCLDLTVGDLDYDGTSYWADWPTGPSIDPATSATPSSFAQSPPTSRGDKYGKYLFQTDTALSESTCSGTTGAGCTVPPSGPGNFYPYWSIARSHGQCTIEFGNVSSGAGVNSFGGDAQYGTVQSAKLGYPEFESREYANNCST